MDKQDILNAFDIQDLYLQLLAAWGDSPLDEEEVKKILLNTLIEFEREIISQIRVKIGETTAKDVWPKIDDNKDLLPLTHGIQTGLNYVKDSILDMLEKEKRT